MTGKESENMDQESTVSVIMCMRNSQEWLLECLESIENQTYQGRLELSIFDDGSSDSSAEILENWLKNSKRVIQLVKSKNENTEEPKGVGYGKNRAIEQSSGQFFCFMDSDDVMHSERIAEQLVKCRENPGSIVGTKIVRVPEDSTPRYTEWANSLSPLQLRQQIYTCFGPTVLMPTWFCTRETFEKVGKFQETEARGTPEDLIFFFQHIRGGGGVVRVDRVLLDYRYHPQATTFSVTDETIWKIRLKELEEHVLSKWPTFTIWNAGKEGRRLYRSLSKVNQDKVVAMADVDVKKIAKKFYTFEESRERKKPKIPIIHFSDLKPPVVICVKLGLSMGGFERNLASMDLREDIDFVHFG